jgi:hypothetical protein
MEVMEVRGSKRIHLSKNRVLSIELLTLVVDITTEEAFLILRFNLCVR